MVRNIAGTLVEVGRRMQPADWVKEVLEAKDRGLAGATAPGHGLTLLPHAMHAVCWQLAVFVFSVKVKVTLTPVGKDRGMPPTVSHGVCRQVPDVPPQFASEVHGMKRFEAAFVVHSFGAHVPVLVLSAW